MRTKIIILFFAGALASVMAQESPTWKHTKEDDPLHGKVHDRLVLSGKYLTPPRLVAEGFMPSIVVSCSEGKVESNYISFGAVVVASEIGGVHMPARIDGKGTSVGGDAISTDGQSVFFPRVYLKKILKAHQVILGVNEFLGPQVVVQFDMPDPAPIFASCGKDRILKEK
jgi:hypothetical protein